jgi:hypothetical protein
MGELFQSLERSKFSKSDLRADPNLVNLWLARAFWLLWIPKCSFLFNMDAAESAESLQRPFGWPDPPQNDNGPRYPQRPLHVVVATTGSVASVKAPLIVGQLLKVIQLLSLFSNLAHRDSRTIP